MHIQSFEIVSVPVKDQQVSKRFYRDVLGFELIRETAVEGGMTWIQLSLPGHGVTIALVTWLEKMPPGALQGVVLNTSSIEEDHRVLKHLGVDVSDIRDEPWGRYVMFSDPDGNGWVLREPLQQR